MSTDHATPQTVDRPREDLTAEEREMLAWIEANSDTLGPLAAAIRQTDDSSSGEVSNS